MFVDLFSRRPRQSVVLSFLVFTMIMFVTVNLVSCVTLPNTLEHDKSLSFTMIDDYAFHTHVVGESDKPLVVVIHGGPGGDYRYLSSLEALSDTHRIVFYDQRGSGLSPRVDNNALTLETNTQDLHAIVQHFATDTPISLVGHSWGGMLAVHYLSLYPDSVTNAIIIEPGMLTPESAESFVTTMKAHQRFSDVLTLVRHMLSYPFVEKVDGHEGFDYVMTQLLNQNNPGAPYQCEGQSMPSAAFVRGGFEAFNQMLKPVMNDPSSFTHDLTDGIQGYQGRLTMLSSECSVIGYDYQQALHMPLMPAQTVHIKAENMGHNMLTIHPKWSLDTLRQIL